MNPVLPEGWGEATLAQVCSLITDGTHHSPPNYSSGEFMYVTAKNVRPTGLDLSNITYVSEPVHREIYKRCPAAFGDVLYIKDGATTGIAALNTVHAPISLLSSVALLKPRGDLVDACYLKHWLNSPEVFREFTDNMTGSAIKRVVLRQIREATISFAPLAEQRRIVEKVEALLARVDAATERLQRVEQIITRLGTSCLDQSLGFGGGVEKEIVKLSAVLREPLRNGHSARASDDGQGVRTLTLSAVTNGDFSMANTKMTIADRSRVHDLWLNPGDILVERANTPELVGTARLYEGPMDFAIFPDLMIRVRVREDMVLPRYLERVLHAETSRKYFRDAAQGSAGTMPKISQGTIENFEFILPPLAKQAEIDNRIEALDQLKLAIGRRVAIALARAATLPQAILAKAFAGELVPTEAELARRENREYEPASVLLERVANERKPAAKASRPARERSRRA